ncbi:type II toxin-antitoxin system RelE/ParE family toxin [uncultured Methanoregula sp.]|uniref:type II toxin-antitoxin system RelE family toxin n=1 Tax=uncultured Methanoregula sp. TaxID=1005933 RepID=UPI002AAB8A0D|nr:type II toxin-antitoxin system RelE/ParE family toxin [uncultured Methanoregula sp.]
MYSVHLSRRAQKDLLDLQKKDARRIREALNDLAAEENPQACVKKLKGHENVPLYSCRIGPYRAILTIDNGILVIFVITIDNRSSVYRNI